MFVFFHTINGSDLRFEGCKMKTLNMIFFSLPAGKPSPPVNLSHVQTIQPELILMWNDAEYDPATDLMRYEVRYSFNRTHPDWQVNI